MNTCKIVKSTCECVSEVVQRIQKGQFKSSKYLFITWGDQCNKDLINNQSCK